MMNMNSAIPFKILFSQDKKTKLHFLRFDTYTPLFIYNIYNMYQDKIIHDLQEIFPISYNKYLIIISIITHNQIHNPDQIHNHHHFHCHFHQSSNLLPPPHSSKLTLPHPSSFPSLTIPQTQG